eukprot:6260886-Amphidinium_carterae.1
MLVRTAEVRIYFAFVSSEEDTSCWRCLTLSWAVSMACPRRTAVTKDDAAVWPLLPALKFKSSGPDVRASVLLAQRSARSAM